MGRVGQTVLVHIVFLWYLRMDIENLFCLERVSWRPGCFRRLPCDGKERISPVNKWDWTSLGGLWWARGGSFERLYLLWYSEVLPFITGSCILLVNLCWQKQKLRLVNFLNSISRSLSLYFFIPLHVQLWRNPDFILRIPKSPTSVPSRKNLWI